MNNYKSRPPVENFGERENSRSQDLRDSHLMSHLLEALQAGEDIGDFGRLTFVMVARFFMSEDQIIQLLARQPVLSQWEAQAFVHQIIEADYTPPTADRIHEWQDLQEFSICPQEDTGSDCDVYQELAFPQEIYERVAELEYEPAGQHS